MLTNDVTEMDTTESRPVYERKSGTVGSESAERDAYCRRYGLVVEQEKKDDTGGRDASGRTRIRRAERQAYTSSGAAGRDSSLRSVSVRCGAVATEYHATRIPIVVERSIARLACGSADTAQMCAASQGMWEAAPSFQLSARFPSFSYADS